MEIGNETVYAGQIADIERQKIFLGEQTISISATPEEYLSLEREDRMGMAMLVFSLYANVSRDQKPVTVQSAIAGVDGFHLEARLLYLEAGRGDPYPPGWERPRIIVTPEVVDKESGIKSLARGSQGVLLYGKGNSDYYSQQVPSYRETLAAREGWHIETRGGYAAHSLDEQIGKDIVSFIDAAVCEMIEGPVTRHRAYLGKQAVQAEAA